MAREFANTAGSPNIDYVTYSGVPPVAGLATCSIVMRVAIDSDCPNYGSIFVCEDAARDDGIGAGRHGTGNDLFALFRNAEAVKITRFPFTCDGTMRSVVVTYDGGATPKVVAYVAGTSQTVTDQPTSTTIGTPTEMGLASDTGFRMNGRLAELAIYNRVLTQAEATMHAAGFSCRNFPRGLIFYAPLIREVHDIAGGLTGTITGTTVSDHPRIYA